MVGGARDSTMDRFSVTGLFNPVSSLERREYRLSQALHRPRDLRGAAQT